MRETTHNLYGLRILNTRPQSQAKALEQDIEQAGGYSISLPTIAIMPIDNACAHLPDLSTFQHAIFISSNAVHHAFQQLQATNREWPSSLDVTAIGHGSAKALTDRHIKVQHIPDPSNSDGLLQLPVFQDVLAKHILLVKGENGRTLITETLQKRGASVFELPVYRRECPTHYQSSYLHTLWQEDGMDIILFTSQQSVHNLFKLFDAAAWPWLCSKPCVVISARIALLAKAYGIHTIMISRYETLLDTLCERINDA